MRDGSVFEHNHHAEVFEATAARYEVVIEGVHEFNGRFGALFAQPEAEASKVVPDDIVLMQHSVGWLSS